MQGSVVHDLLIQAVVLRRAHGESERGGRDWIDEVNGDRETEIRLGDYASAMIRNGGDR